MMQIAENGTKQKNNVLFSYNKQTTLSFLTVLFVPFLLFIINKPRNLKFRCNNILKFRERTASEALGVVCYYTFWDSETQYQTFQQASDNFFRQAGSNWDCFKIYRACVNYDYDMVIALRCRQMPYQIYCHICETVSTFDTLLPGGLCLVPYVPRKNDV